MIPNFLREKIALQVQPYTKKVNLLGSNLAVGTSFETVRASSSAVTQLLAAVAMEAISGSVNDDGSPAGTGAQTLTVEGLDTNWDEIAQTVTMDGTSAVTLSTNLLAVNRVYVATSGSGLVNAGAIDVRVVSGAVVQKQIVAGEGRARDFMYTVPRKYVGLLSSIRINASTVPGTTEVRLLLKDSAGNTIEEGAAKFSAVGRYEIDLGDGLLVPEKTMIELQAKDSTGGGIVCAQAQLLLFHKKEAGFF